MMPDNPNIDLINDAEYTNVGLFHLFVLKILNEKLNYEGERERGGGE